MNTEYSDTLTALLARTRPRLAMTHRLDLKSCFGAVAGYVDGNIFVTCGRFGTALKLPPSRVDQLLVDREGIPLRYFDKGHVKKGYVVLSERLLEDRVRLKKLVDQSIRFVKRAPRIATRRRKPSGRA